MGWLRRCLGAVSAMGLVCMVGCGGSSTSTPPPALGVTLGSSTVVVPQDGTAVTMTVTITNASATPTVTTEALPTGVTAQFTPVNGGPSGTLTLTGSAQATAGSYSPTVAVSAAGQSSTAGFTLVSAVVAKVGSGVDTTMGVNGVLKEFMSTSFQVAEWDGDYFGGANASSLESTMTAMGPQHIRLQTVSQGVAMSTNTGTAADWNFTIMDQTVQPVLASADHSPEFQIATAPAWMCLSNGQLDVTNHVKDFAVYAANLVRYYNKGGFDYGGTHFQ